MNTPDFRSLTASEIDFVAEPAAQCTAQLPRPRPRQALASPWEAPAPAPVSSRRYRWCRWLRYRQTLELAARMFFPATPLANGGNATNVSKIVAGRDGSY